MRVSLGWEITDTCERYLLPTIVHVALVQPMGGDQTPTLSQGVCGQPKCHSHAQRERDNCFTIQPESLLSAAALITAAPAEIIAALFLL